MPELKVCTQNKAIKRYVAHKNDHFVREILSFVFLDEKHLEE